MKYDGLNHTCKMAVAARPQNFGKFRRRIFGEHTNNVSNPISFDQKFYRLTLIVNLDWFWFKLVVLVLFLRFQKLIERLYKE